MTCPNLNFERATLIAPSAVRWFYAQSKIHFLHRVEIGAEAAHLISLHDSERRATLVSKRRSAAESGHHLLRFFFFRDG